MAGGQERILRRRIRSIQSTKKITRAMELIAASRILKAQARVHAAQPYADGITQVVGNLAGAGSMGAHPLLAPREAIRNVAHIAIAADRGLAGGYNSTIVRTTEAEMREHRAHGRENLLVTVGRKAEGYFRFREVPIEASFTGFSENPTYQDARAIARVVSERFVAGDLDLVQVIYTRFVSAGRQEVVVRPLMPLDTDDFQPARAAADPSAGARADYEMEPAPDVILGALLPRYAEARLYAALLNAAASEHAFRQRAMKAATDNADELIRNLSRVMNRARQDAITTEIMEIVGGAEALGHGRPHDDELLPTT